MTLLSRPALLVCRALNITGVALGLLYAVHGVAAGAAAALLIGALVVADFATDHLRTETP